MKSKNKIEDNGFQWINPIGGFGDQLMLSGVLKLAHDNDPSKLYNLARRTNYLTFLKGHPAIARIGFPPKDADVVGVDYWSMEKLGSGEKRPFQVLARRFGLATPVEEKLYVPWEIRDDTLLQDFIPWGEKNIVIAPSSDSPRKVVHPSIWHNIVHLLKMEGAFIMQVGRLRDVHIRNAYSLLGLTTAEQLLSLIRRCDLVITSDNFIMHAAHLLGVKAVVIWGPTSHEVYGYPEQIHFQMPKSCDLEDDVECIGPGKNNKGKLYGTPCPQKENHCINKVKPVEIFDAAKNALMMSR